ncbi:MAG: Protein-L-isoaspartate O-methyltransferase [Pelotomaculum sp. PtaU1.Bin035]|nr:MAG: Protein-L-isoaspartate O-methyltransferase [Pelotomaculum sp. PtaU1.Bin035]
MTYLENNGAGANNRADERRRMVEDQLISNGITNKAVIQSMLTVPRHCFVSTRLQAYAYYDCPLLIGEGQTISQPYIVALMADALETTSADRVLEIGTGSGYAAAVLSRLASMVYTVERHESLASEARSRFQALKYANIRVHTGDGTKGWPEEAPFDGIVVAAGAPEVPKSLGDQLKPGGRLVIPVGERGSQELLRVRKKADNSFTREYLGAVRFVPLIGEEGWNGRLK